MSGNALVPLMLVGLFIATFWLYVYSYALYRVGRWIATRHRTRPIPSLALIALGSAVLTLPIFFLGLSPIWKSTIVFGIWMLHTQAVGYGFWGGMELGRRHDDQMFWHRTEEWLKEWEEPVPKWFKDGFE